MCLVSTLLQSVLSVPKPEISKLRRNKVSKRQLDQYGSPLDDPIDSIDTYGPPRAQPCELQVREASKKVSLLLQNHVQSVCSISQKVWWSRPAI